MLLHEEYCWSQAEGREKEEILESGGEENDPKRNQEGKGRGDVWGRILKMSLPKEGILKKEETEETSEETEREDTNCRFCMMLEHICSAKE